MSAETYLGDGLYASFDGWYFCLRAPREEGDHMVFLEPRVLQEFMAYVMERQRMAADVEKGSHH